MERDDIDPVDFESMDMPVPPAFLKSMELKRTFKIPDRKPEGSKASGAYNHPWPLTDLLICWDMKWDQHQVQAVVVVNVAVLHIDADTRTGQLRFCGR